MVQLTLPRNSKVQRGKTWNEPENKGKWKEFRVYRWNPDDERESAPRHLLGRRRSAAGRWFSTR